MLKFSCTVLRICLGSKINYQKSEVIVLGASEDESSQIAKWLNC
jgi:hypothetical protein